MISKRIFRILKNIKIIYSKSKKYNGQCSHSPKGDLAIIYPCPKAVNPDEYRFHEFLHVALKRLRSIPESKKRETEEKLVQDISKFAFRNYVQ